MAYLTNLLVQVVSRVDGTPKSCGVMLNNGGGGSTLSSGNAAGGYYQFTGLVAGLYDIVIVTPSYNVVTSNYAIQNSFLIPVGESSIAEEGRTYIRSQETVVGAGILQENLSNLTGTVSGVGYFSEPRALPWPVATGTTNALVDTFSSQVGFAKQTGNSYYHSNQNTTFSQKIGISA